MTEGVVRGCQARSVGAVFSERRFSHRCTHSVRVTLTYTYKQATLVINNIMYTSQVHRNTHTDNKQAVIQILVSTQFKCTIRVHQQTSQFCRQWCVLHQTSEVSITQRTVEYYSVRLLNLCCRKARHLQMHHCKPDIWQETVQWGSHSCFLVTLMIHDVQLFMYTTTLLIHNCTSTTPSWWSIASGILSRASHNHCDEKIRSGKGSGNIHWRCCLCGLAKHLTEEDLDLGS